MDELFIVAFAVGVLVLLGLGALLGWLAFLRSNDARRRIERLEAQMREVRSSAAGPPGSTVANETAAAPAPAWRAAPPAPYRHAPTPPPVPPSPLVAATPERPSAVQPPPIAAAQPTAAAPKPAEPAGEWSSAASMRVESAPRAAAVARKPAFELERWIGVRGAAVLGGVFLIIAGFLFLQYSIERGWVTPEVRLTVGGLSGVACILTGLVLRKRAYLVLANSLTGAGIVLLYAVAWAAHVVYGRIEFLSAFSAMVAVTAFCAWLSYRHSSQLIAVLGFVGGFATPLALSTGQDRPLGLFGYALLLDLGFLFVAHKRRWPSIAMVGVLGTFLLQGLWAFAHLDARSLPIALGALAVFGLLFTIFIARQPSAERAGWIPAQAGALLLPFLFVLYFAQTAELGFHLAPLAALAAVMAIAAGIMARLQKAPWLALGASAGALALVLVWTVSNLPELGIGRTWELVVVSLVLSAIPHGLAELARRREPQSPAALAPTTISTLGFLIVCVFSTTQANSVPLWPWTLACMPLGLLLLRSVALGVHFAFGLYGALLAGIGFAGWAASNAHSELFPPAWLFFACLIGCGLLWCFAARWFTEPLRTRAHWAAGLFCLPALVAACNFGQLAPPPLALFLLVVLVLGMQMALAAGAARSAILFGTAVVCTLAAQLLGTRLDVSAIAEATYFPQVLGVFVASAVLFTLLPFLGSARLRAVPGFWRVAAVASLPWFLLVQDFVVARHGPALRFVTALGFALFVGALSLRLWKRGEPEVDAQARAQLDAASERARDVRVQSCRRAWFGAVALFYASFVLPMHVDREPFALGLALFAAALAWLWTRSDHRALKFLAVAVLCAATLQLTLFHAFEILPRAPRRILNWNAYLMLLPGFAAGLAAWLLRSRELVRVRGIEAALYRSKIPVATTLAAACCLVLSFVWLNLEVADAFGTGDSFRWALRGEPEPSLALSIAWALFALVLLVLGVRRAMGGLRWASLGLLVLTIAKVFLLDLGHLDGLYRVASMLGLALSLLLVSFFYQRFVFRRARAAS